MNTKLIRSVALGISIALGSTAAIAGHHEEKKMEKSQPTIVDIAASDDRFSTLVAAVKAADLVDTLNSSGPFTVFAPTNDAFAALPEGTLDTLLKPENKGKLTDILTYHVVSGEVPASAVVSLESAETVQGDTVDIKVSDGTVMIDGAKVVITDIKASNGIIHVIDAVILPETKTAASAR